MKTILLSLIILLDLSPVRTQVGDGSIEGVIRDLSGAAVAKASVYAYDYYNFRKRINTTADSDGRFVFRDVPSGTYIVHAYKENEGYPDTFFSFFDAGNHKAWRRVEVEAEQTTNANLELGPKYAVLKLSIKDEQGNSISGSLTFTRVDDPKRPYGVGVTPNAELLVPPVPFRFQIEAKGYQIWQSKIIRPRSGETVSVTARLKRSR
jgi:hypothetical protein